jgi:hypothetical protein
VICNACGEDKPGSREHLIHVHVGRVLAQVGAEIPGDEVRRTLRQGMLGEFEIHKSDAETRPAFLADKVVQDLLCRDCNSGWANELEVEAAEHLAILLADRRRARGEVLRRWAAFFAIKAWWIDRRTTPLREGPLRPVLEILATASATIELPIRLARLDTSPSRWMFALWIDPTDPPSFRTIAWVTRSVLWVFMLQSYQPKGQPLPFRTRELESLYLRQLPTIRPSDLMTLPAVARTLPKD